MWAGPGWRGGGAECWMAREPGARRHTRTQVSAICEQTVGHQARPHPPGPWVGWRETRGVFARPREEPRRRPLARAGVRGLCWARRAARGAFQSPPASRGSPASLFPADAPPRSLGLRRLVATGAPGTSLRGAGGLAGVVWPAIAARSREAALLETGESLSQLCASSRLSAAGLRSHAAQPAWGKGE